MNNQKLLEKTWFVCIAACFCCLLWGSAFPSIKIGYQLFQIPQDASASQILFAGCRFTLAGILVILFGSVLSGKSLVPKRSSIGIIVKVSLFQTILQYFFFYLGLAHASGVKASIVEASNVFIAIIVANLIFHQEKFTVKTISGCVIGFIGVILINVSKGSLAGGVSFIGEGFILISAVSYGISSSLLKRYSSYENPVVVSGYQFFLGGIVMIIGGLCMGGTLAPTGFSSYIMLLYMALISAVAYTIWGILLKYNPVSKVAIFGFTNPLFGVILSFLFLHETASVSLVQCIASLLFVCVGIFIVNK